MADPREAQNQRYADVRGVAEEIADSFTAYPREEAEQDTYKQAFNDVLDKLWQVAKTGQGVEDIV